MNRARVIDRPFMEFARSCGCVLRRVAGHKCLGPMTFHHVRSYGSVKDDTCGFGLCAWGHLHTYNSKSSIEALGKQKFEQHWGISIEQEIQRLRKEYECRN